MPAPDWTVLLAAVVVTLQIGLRLVALGVIPGNRKPSTGMAWLLLILLEPFIGFAAFLMFGRTRLGRKRSDRQRRAHEAILQRTDLDATHSGEGQRDHVRSVIHLNRTLGALPMVDGNRVDLIPDYETSLREMTEAIGTATSYVHAQFYITAWDDMTDPFFRALVAATERGVTVRLLFDHLGSRGIPGYQDMLRRLEETDIEWRPMLPIKPLERRWRRPDLRNHRKMLVVDGRLAFAGSQNLTEPGYNKPKNHRLGRKWVELMVRLEGPVARELDTVFSGDWYVETDEIPDTTALPAPAVSDGVPCQLVPSGPGFVAENNLRMFTTLIYSATSRISLTSPYFVPDESLLYAVTTAAQRGIAVELFVSEVSDQFMVGHAQASYYRALLEAGVRIFEYPAPFILHSKHFTIDDDVAVIGSSNMDMRSFALNYEVSLMMLGRPIVERMREVEDQYRAISRELTLEAWGERPVRLKYVDNVMRLTAALQ